MHRGGGAPGPANGSDVVAGLTRWLAEQRADAAAASRARERWLRQAAEEEATVAGVLLDLAERGEVVVLRLGDRTRRGQVRAVGEDFVALRTTSGDVLARHDAVVAIRGEGRAPVGADRAPVLAIGLAEALAALAGERPRVTITTPLGATLTGDLRSVGRDVATVVHDDRSTTFVPLASVAEVALLKS